MAVCCTVWLRPPAFGTTRPPMYWLTSVVAVKDSGAPMALSCGMRLAMRNSLGRVPPRGYGPTLISLFAVVNDRPLPKLRSICTDMTADRSAGLWPHVHLLTVIAQAGSFTP